LDAPRWKETWPNAPLVDFNQNVGDQKKEKNQEPQITPISQMTASEFDRQSA
jgi:hypothetical protein